MGFVGFGDGVDELLVTLDITQRHWLFGSRGFEAKFCSLLRVSEVSRKNVLLFFPWTLGHILTSRTSISFTREKKLGHI